MTVLLESHSLEVRVVDDHVSYLQENKEPLHWPHFTGEGGPVTISVGNMPFDTQLAENLFGGLANLPHQRHAWLLTLSQWYIRCLHEVDPWKRFLWSYMSLEILFNKQWTKGLDNLLFSLTHVGADGVARPAIDLPIAEVMYNGRDPGRVPVAAKLAFLALSLFPDRAMADVELFRELKAARDGISHGSWQLPSDPPAGKCVDLLKRYLAAAIRSELGITLE